MTSYPTVEEVIAVHAQLIARFGGALGIRDRGALESALARPQSGYYRTSVKKPRRFGKACPRIIHLWTATNASR